MVVHWFVVMSQKTVRILTIDRDTNELKQLKLFDNPLGRLRKHDLVKKQAGRGQKSIGRTGLIYYSESKRSDPHEDAALQFAKQITDYLELERQQKKFQSLTIVAEPRFLGKVRSSMSPSLKKLVKTWQRKDLLKTPQSKWVQILV